MGCLGGGVFEGFLWVFSGCFVGAPWEFCGSFVGVLVGVLWAFYGLFVGVLRAFRRVFWGVFVRALWGIFKDYGPRSWDRVGSAGFGRVRHRVAILSRTRKPVIFNGWR